MFLLKAKEHLVRIHEMSVGKGNGNGWKLLFLWHRGERSEMAQSLLLDWNGNEMSNFHLEF